MSSMSAHDSNNDQALAIVDKELKIAQLPQIVLQMQLDLQGADVEDLQNSLAKKQAELDAHKNSLNNQMPHDEYVNAGNIISGVRNEIQKIQKEINQKFPDIQIAKLPEKTRRNIYLKKLALRLIGPLVLGGFTVFSLFAAFLINGGFAVGVLVGLISTAIVSLACFDGFSRSIYLDPEKYFKLSASQEIAKIPAKLNKLCHQWLGKIGLKRIERAIERLGELAGQWDNQLAKLEALLKQAQDDENKEAESKVKFHIKRLQTIKERLQSRLNTLKTSRNHLLSLQTYDMQLMEIEAEIDCLGEEAELFLIQTTKLLTQIRDTVDLALTAEVETLISSAHDVNFEQLESLIQQQVEAGAAIQA